MDQASSNKNDLQQGRCVEPLIWSENSERTAYGHRCVRGVPGASRRVYFALFAPPPCGTCLYLVGLCCRTHLFSFKAPDLCSASFFKI